VTTDQVPGLLTIVLLVGLAWAGMAWGWRRRARRQADLPPPASPPADPGPPAVSVEGLYVGTVLAEQWLERVVGHGLGARAGATLAVHPDGLRLDRDGSQPVWVPAADLEAVRRDTGLAGKVTETGGLVVWTWRLGADRLESGLRPRFASDADPLVAALQALVRGDGQE
jgi:MYXO-CTERM domain-containing protein